MTSSPPSGHDGPYESPVKIWDRRVLAEWIDFNGHMNAAFYGIEIQSAAEQFLEDHTGFGATFSQSEGAGPFVLQNHLHFLGELNEGETFSIYGRLLDHDTKRMHMYFEMIANDSGVVCATAEYLNMNVNLTTRRPEAFPAWLQKRLGQMLKDHSVLDRPANVGAPIGIRR